MTKDIDFLSLDKSTDSKNINTNTNATTSKKDGLSLFDSLIVNNQKNKASEEKVDSKENKSNTNINTDVDKKDISKELNNKKETTTLESDVKKETKSADLNPNKKLEVDIKEKNTSESKEQTPNKISSTSLLDRMILEANKKVKTINTDELVSDEKKSSPKVNPIDSKETINNTNRKEVSLLDKIIGQAKTVSSDEVKSEQKTDGKIIDNKNIKPDNLDTEKSTDNKNTLISDKKEDITKNKNVSPSETKEDIKKNENLLPSDTKKDKEITTDKKVEVNENKISVDLEDKKEIKKETSDIKDKEIKVENKIEKLVSEPKIDNQNLELNNKDSKNTEIKDSIKDIKTVIKNDIESNITPDKKDIKNTETNKIVDEVKINKNTDNSLNIEKKLEQKEVTNAKDIKNTDLNLKENVKADKLVTTNEVEKSLNQNSKVDLSTNENSTKKLSNLDSEAIVKDNQRVNVDKKDLLTETPKENLKENTSNSKSLMERLLDNAKNNTLSPKETVSNEPLKEQTSTSKSNDVVTNIFLSNQKNSIYNQMLSTKKEGTKIVKDGTNIEDVKKGAEILDLGLKKASVEVSSVNKNVKVDESFDNDALLDKLAFTKNIRKDDISTLNTNISSSNSATQTTIATSTANLENAVNLNVNPSLALSIQNRIIGAQQNMSSMLSDVARNMYENYKPPVTAFRINLFPSQLGHIAILMKNDKENGLSISMNMSNSNTLDSFVENQNTLREALNKNFNNNETTFELDFNLQDQNPNQSNQQDENQNKENNESHSSDEILESIVQNQNVGEDLNYL